MSCWYQVVRFIYLISQFFVVFQQGPLLEVVEVRNNRGQELVTRISGYSGPMHYVTFSFSLAICCSSSCVCQNKSRMHINLGEQYLCYRQCAIISEARVYVVYVAGLALINLLSSDDVKTLRQFNLQIVQFFNGAFF